MGLNYIAGEHLWLGREGVNSNHSSDDTHTVCFVCHQVMRFALKRRLAYYDRLYFGMWVCLNEQTKRGPNAFNMNAGFLDVYVVEASTVFVKATCGRVPFVLIRPISWAVVRGPITRRGKARSTGGGDHRTRLCAANANLLQNRLRKRNCSVRSEHWNIEFIKKRVQNTTRWQQATFWHFAYIETDIYIAHTPGLGMLL